MSPICTATWWNIPPWSGCSVFHCTASRKFTWGFDVQASLPTHRHLSRMLRDIPNRSLQFLLDRNGVSDPGRTGRQTPAR